MTKEDKKEYCRQYYNKTKGERHHEYSLVSRRAFLRKKIKLIGLDNPTKVAELQKQVDAINAELKPIRDARWEAKRAAGGALFKHFSDNDITQVINELPTAIQ